MSTGSHNSATRRVRACAGWAPSPKRGIQTVGIPDSAISLDLTRIYRDAYERAGRDHGLIADDEAEIEAASEFDEEEDAA